MALNIRNGHDRDVRKNHAGFETLTREIRDQISLGLQSGDIDESQAQEYEGLLAA